MSDKIILRHITFMKWEDFHTLKKSWEYDNPDTLLIPCTMQVENPRDCRGYWIDEEDKQWAGGGFTKCSICGYGYSWGQYDIDEFKYCPRCGAEMIGRKDEKDNL